MGNCNQRKVLQAALRVAPQRPPSDPFGLAIEWVSRILAIGFVMVAFGLAGQFLGEYLGLPLLNPLGWVVGMIFGFMILLIVAGVWKPRRSKK